MVLARNIVNFRPCTPATTRANPWSASRYDRELTSNTSSLAVLGKVNLCDSPAQRLLGQKGMRSVKLSPVQA
ncbi:hypothetical protein TNCV_3839051 [Trichonephila clavipes]|nr:hypothetical protein TNCV_3839051 [Trichonephila clavipes]